MGFLAQLQGYALQPSEAPTSGILRSLDGVFRERQGRAARLYRERRSLA